MLCLFRLPLLALALLHTPPTRTAHANLLKNLHITMKLRPNDQSTLAQLREYIKTNKLDIKTSGPGRSKAQILADILQTVKTQPAGSHTFTQPPILDSKTQLDENDLAQEAVRDYDNVNHDNEGDEDVTQLADVKGVDDEPQTSHTKEKDDHQHSAEKEEDTPPQLADADEESKRLQLAEAAARQKAESLAAAMQAEASLLSTIDEARSAKSTVEMRIEDRLKRLQKEVDLL